MRFSRVDNTQLREHWNNSDADKKDGIQNSEKFKKSSWLMPMIGLIVFLGILIYAIFFR